VTDFKKLLEVLTDHRVEFIVIGGVALIAHGHARLTEDLDICYRRTPENLEKLAAALEPLGPTLRGAPPGLPFRVDALTLKSGLNFTLQSSAGDIDLLGEVTGIGGYSELAGDAVERHIYGRPVRIMSLSALERSKLAAGRAKDLGDLEAIREIKKRVKS
jgi:hypothetical protein